MRWEAGKKYYYVIHYKKTKEFSHTPNEIGAAIVVPIRDSNDLFPAVKIEKILTPGIYLGHEYRIKEGEVISANELQGGGAENHYFGQYEFVKRIFIGEP